MGSARRASATLIQTAKRKRAALVLTSSLILLALIIYRYFRCSPDYTDLWLQEERDSLELERSGKMGGLVAFRQLKGAGFNNQIQETLFLSHLTSTLSPSHTYVPPPVYWQPRGLSPIPLSAFLDGLPPHPSDAYFRRVCPEPKRVQWEIPKPDELLENLRALLKREEGERCLVVEGARVVQWSWLETDAFLVIWDGYSKDFLPKVRFSRRALKATEKSVRKLGLGDLEDVLAVHLRRGDFASHCPYLFKTASSYTGWNRLLPPPAGLDMTNETSFMEHCYPTVPQMVATIERFLATQPASSKPVRALFVAHDFTHKPWLLPHFRQLELELLRSPHSMIRRVRSSSDHHLPWRDRDLLVVVDMEIARRAGGGLISNGWSSLSGAVVGWRKLEGGKGRIGFW